MTVYHASNWSAVPTRMENLKVVCKKWSCIKGYPRKSGLAACTAPPASHKIILHVLHYEFSALGLQDNQTVTRPLCARLGVELRGYRGCYRVRLKA